MATIQQCEDFKPEYTKQYVMNGRRFLVKLQYRGVEPGDVFDMEPLNVWAFELYYKDELTTAGPFRHTVNEPMTLQSVANNLASFFGGGDLDALLEQTREERKAKNLTIEDHLEWCVNLMFEELIPQNLNGISYYRDYDVLNKTMTENGWTIILSPAVQPERLYMFDYLTTRTYVSVETYIKGHVFSVGI
jgi:hypothetical protein